MWVLFKIALEKAYYMDWEFLHVGKGFGCEGFKWILIKR